MRSSWRADFPGCLSLAARVHAQQGRIDEAQRALDTLGKKRSDDVTSEALALGVYIAAIRGDRKAAIAIVKQLEADPAAQHVMPYYAAKVYAALNEPDHALSHLERAAEERAAQIVFVAVDPEFAALRNDPRLRALMRSPAWAGADD